MSLDIENQTMELLAATVEDEKKSVGLSYPQALLKSRKKLVAKSFSTDANQEPTLSLLDHLPMVEQEYGLLCQHCQSVRLEYGGYTTKRRSIGA